MRHITTKNVDGFSRKAGTWVVDGKPPEPSMAEKEHFPTVKTPSPRLIARRHGVDERMILQQLELGIEVEKEHTANPQMAREIALDHLNELPDYYTRLNKMEESDIQDILHRAGIQTEAQKSTRNLDTFEHFIVDIALRLIDEGDDMDPQTAGMDILDAVNDRVMTESVRRKAGTWYDPMKRALEILENELPEDVFADMKARMAAQADDYLKQRDSSMQHADTQKGVADPEPEGDTTSLGAMAKELDTIRRLAIRDSYQISRENMQKLAQIIQALQKLETTAGQGIKMRFKKWAGMEAEIRARAGIMEQCECEIMDAEGDKVDAGHDLYTMLNTQRIMMGSMIPELREIAKYSIKDERSKQRLGEIADALASLQWKIHGERERGFGQAWTDVERQPTLWHGKV